MIENGLMSYRNTALDIGISNVTVRDLVKALGLTPKPMSNGKAKGLDKKDRNTIRRALGMPINAAGGRSPATATA